MDPVGPASSFQEVEAISLVRLANMQASEKQFAG
jgi:hypothetical protein